jgi:hypothetical protein
MTTMPTNDLAAIANRIIELVAICPKGIPLVGLLEQLVVEDRRTPVAVMNALIRAGFVELAVERLDDWAGAAFEFAHEIDRGRPAAVILTTVDEDGVREESIAVGDRGAGALLALEDIVVRARALPCQDQVLQLDPADLGIVDNGAVRQ